MSYVRGVDRQQVQLLPSSVEEYVPAEAPVRFVDAFVGELDLAKLGFARAQAASTGRPPYNPADLLKLYLYGYLQRIRSSRRLEAEASRFRESSKTCYRQASDSRSAQRDRRACLWHIAPMDA